MTPPPIAAGSAPGKIILFGEHAVVYGHPAIAAPLSQVRAQAHVVASTACTVAAIDIRRQVAVTSAPADDPFALIIRLVCAELGQPLPPWRIEVHSDIPIASGLGSGAAISAALARAVLAAFSASLPPSRLSELVYEVEKLHHGTPSGIDNTVVVYEQPVWFVRGQAPQAFGVGARLPIVVADTGVPSPTRVAVADVRRAWQADPSHYEALFERIAACSRQARLAIEAGDMRKLGALMNENQALLTEIGVSSPELAHLVRCARQAGALGAKLSGGGRGGNMIALVAPERVAPVVAALKACARRVIQTELLPHASRTDSDPGQSS